MLYRPSTIKGTHLNQTQKHSSAIMSVDQKYKANKKIHDKRIHLSPQQKTKILENGALIFQFIKDKLDIVKEISSCEGEMNVENCMRQEFKNGILELQQIASFVNDDFLAKLQKQIAQKSSLAELNELIYSSLTELSGINLNFFEKINKLKNISIQTQRTKKNASISSQIQASSSIKKHSKGSKIQNSTNHLSRVNSQELPKVNSFKYIINVQEQQILNQQDSNQSNIQDSLDQGHEETEKINQNDQKKKEYFYAFVISLSATESLYHNFLDSLYDELLFDNQFSPQKVQKAMMEDDQYCMRILIIALTNKFKKMIKHSKFTQNPEIIYFPNEANFLKLILHFIQSNTEHMTNKISDFCNKVHQIKESIQKIDRITSQEEREQTLQNTLSQYLPQTRLNQNKYYLPQTNFQNLKQDMLKSCRIKHELQPLSQNLLILEKIILKICLNRISSCKRHNLEAARTFFKLIKNSNVLKFILLDGLQNIYEFSEEAKQCQKKQEEALKFYKCNFLKNILVCWKSIKQRKQILLKMLLKKKIKIEKKEQTFIFSRWRINISRKRIQQKMMAHSSSCTAIINKFTEDQIEAFEQKKKKKTESIEKSIQMMSGITVKKSSSLKKSISHIREIKDSKTKIFHIKDPRHNDQDLRLLNYQYKQEILDKLNRQTRKNNENKSGQILKKITRKNFLKV